MPRPRPPFLLLPSLHTSEFRQLILHRVPVVPYARHNNIGTPSPHICRSISSLHCSGLTSLLFFVHCYGLTSSAATTWKYIAIRINQTLALGLYANRLRVRVKVFRSLNSSPSASAVHSTYRPCFSARSRIHFWVCDPSNPSLLFPTAPSRQRPRLRP